MHHESIQPPRSTSPPAGASLGSLTALAFTLAVLLGAGQSPVAACSQRAAEVGIVIAPPASPTGYAVPATAIPVHNTTELANLVAYSPVQNWIPMDIVLEDGVYDPGPLPNGFLSLHGSHRLWARNVAGAVLQFGIAIISPANLALEGGVELHGLAFDIADELHGVRANPPHFSAAVMSWGTGRNLVIEDSVFYGNGAIDSAIHAAQADGLEVRRVRIHGFKRFGVFTSISNGFGWNQDAVLEDLRIAHVGDNEWARSFPVGHEDYDPAYPNYDPADPYEHTEEIGIWMGVPARLSRAYIRDVARGGVVAAGVTEGSVFEDLDVDHIGWRDTGPNAVRGAGLYFDNTSIESVYQRFCVGPDVEKGLISEWDNNTFPRGIRNTVRDGLLESTWLGVGFDQGTVDSRAENLYFRNASWAGLTIYNNVWPNDHLETIEALYTGLHDVGLPPGSCLVTAHHPNNLPPCTTPPPNPQNP